MELPPYLLDVWRLEHGAEAKARRAKQLKGWTTSSLAEANMKYHVENHTTIQQDGDVPSLSDIAVGKILEVQRAPTSRCHTL